MREDSTVAPIARSILFPQLLLGMPMFYAIMVGLAAYEFILILSQYIIGPILSAGLVFWGQFMAKQDPFFFELMTGSLRFRKVLK